VYWDAETDCVADRGVIIYSLRFPIYPFTGRFRKIRTIGISCKSSGVVNVSPPPNSCQISKRLVWFVVTQFTEIGHLDLRFRGFSLQKTHAQPLHPCLRLNSCHGNPLCRHTRGHFRLIFPGRQAILLRRFEGCPKNSAIHPRILMAELKYLGIPFSWRADSRSRINNIMKC
jgi:hypothetical protein